MIVRNRLMITEACCQSMRPHCSLFWFLIVLGTVSMLLTIAVNEEKAIIGVSLDGWIDVSGGIANT